MTLFAGIVARDHTSQIPVSTRESLSSRITRCKSDEVTEISGSYFHFVKVNIGALGGSGMLRDGKDGIALLAGEALIDEAPRARTRDDDLRTLQHAVEFRDWIALTRASGTFCAAFFDQCSGQLTLVADKFGVRPLYYWIGEKYVIFSTALRVIEQLAEVPKRIDAKGVLETAAFGFPLGERTPYLDVLAIREAEIVTIGRQTVDRSHYWRWDQLPLFGGSMNAAADNAYHEFTAAVARRRGSDKTVAAFLSGGLDSRAVVASLRELETTVYTANCSRPGTQDVVFGPQTAAALQCIHQQLGPYHERPGDCYWKHAVSNWLKAIERQENPPERTRIVWGGDGGSVGLGHVYLNQQMVDLMRQGEFDQACDAFLQRNRLRVPTGALNPRAASTLSLLPKQGMLAELDRLNCVDAGRKLHLFLMFNDQRRHLTEHFENIDIDRIEFQLPFFDAKFMEVILSLPIDPCLRHSFYLEWLKRFAPAALSTPWQAYPGHQPCPLPIPPDLEYQWARQAGPAARAEQRKMAAAFLRARFECTQFPKDILSDTRLSLATTLTYLGIQNYSYALKFASTVLRYSEESANGMAWE